MGVNKTIPMVNFLYAQQAQSVQLLALSPCLGKGMIRGGILLYQHGPWRTGFLVHCNSMGLVLQRETSSKTEAETDSILSYPTPEA
ncbi:UNVERIFIED_CONTAM: hypothetical protein Slati_2965000 [Sesamum latifolium]|uniref:Uncharacterized protein n=1 Tax=Sesamum latifolium TaxID=2727402 RepID=A0AAW2SG46_9LAMI